jgi:hypothetical protein
MSEVFVKIITNAEEQVQFISLEIEDIITRSETSIALILKALEQLKTSALKMKFNQVEEIKFFKETKPQLLSKLVYHNKIYKIEMKRPQGGDKVLKKYYNNELDKLKRYFDNELEFYRYYRSNSSYLDHKYFVRGKHDIKLSLDTFYFEADHRFTTTHDYKVAKIIANDLVQVYLEDELSNLERKAPKDKSQVNHKLSQNWTGSKVALIELLYAFQSQGVFNNGKSELKDLAEFIEITFNIDLGQYHRTFLEIRIRQSGRTKFIDSLKETLIKRMDNADEV